MGIEMWNELIAKVLFRVFVLEEDRSTSEKKNYIFSLNFSGLRELCLIVFPFCC